jgi:hypothetical protein
MAGEMAVGATVTNVPVVEATAAQDESSAINSSQEA